jgi:hypothetical protein
MTILLNTEFADKDVDENVKNNYKEFKSVSKSNKRFTILPNNLTKYIRTKSKKIVGGIRAHKIVLSNDKTIVFITHSKTHSKMDKFNKSMMNNILTNRCNYMYDVLYNSKKIRIKHTNSYPAYLNRLYLELETRSKNYFKDCGEIYLYVNMFDYYTPNDQHVVTLSE